MHKSPDLADFWLDFKSLSSGSLSSSSVPWPDKIETLLGVSLALFCSALSSIYRILCLNFSLNPLSYLTSWADTKMTIIKQKLNNLQILEWFWQIAFCQMVIFVQVHKFFTITQLLALIIFVPFFLVRQNMRVLRENLKHKIRTYIIRTAIFWSWQVISWAFTGLQSWFGR